MVVATMEATPASVPRRFDGNGSATAISEPTAGEQPRLVAEPFALPPRKRLSGVTIAAFAALAGVGAIALGSWALVENIRSDDEAAESAASTAQAEQLISLLSNPSTERIPVDGAAGRIILVVGTRGRGYLVLDGLGLAPTGKSYQAWVIKPNAKAPESAGVFAGSELIVPLAVAVQPGAAVAITIERTGGAAAPTQTPKLVARSSA